MGEVDVPDGAYYGPHTARSLRNFPLSGRAMPPDILRAVVLLKQACARANMEGGGLDPAKGEAIVCACGEVLEGKFGDQFPVDVFQAGSGTSTNMNVNEVLANIACEILGGRRGDRSLVHPNDDVNRGQSTNNVFPSAIRMAAHDGAGQLLEAVAHLAKALRAQGRAFAGVLKAGRTHLQDAVPVTLGQEFDAWARALEKAAARIAGARQALLELGIGGNAVGTGLNTRAAFRPAVVKALRESTGTAWRVAEDGLELTQSLADLAAFSAALRLLAADLQKVCNDLRLLASGPRTGLGEIELPAVEPGSSIMPGKVNPGICEAVNMVCMQVMGLDHAVALAAGAGQLELNTHMPLVAANVSDALRLLRSACAVLEEKGIRGLSARRDVCRRHFEESGALATVLNPALGYDRVAELVKESLRDGLTLRQLVLARGLMSEAEFEALLAASTGPRPD